MPPDRKPVERRRAFERASNAAESSTPANTSGGGGARRAFMELELVDERVLEAGLQVELNKTPNE